MKSLQRVRMNIYVQMALWIMMGLALFILHDDTASTYCIVLGIILLIQGMPQLILFMVERTRYLYSFIMLISGFFTSVLGVISITIARDALPYLPLLIGFAILIHAGKEALMLFYINRKTYKNWRILLTLAITTVIASSALILLTWMSNGVDLRPTGLVMIIDAIIECFILYIGERPEDFNLLDHPEKYYVNRW